MTKATVFALSILFFVPPEAGALGKTKAMYVGGTVPGVAEKTEGHIDATDALRLVFYAEKRPGTVAIPWSTVDSIEYGQRVGRRWKTAIFLNPLALFTKGRKHYVTVTYKDARGVDQAVVFELGKEIFRPTLAALKARSGKGLICQDEEAAKRMGGGCTVAPPDPDDEKKPN